MPNEIARNENLTEAQFRALANSIPNMAWMADPDGWLFWYNDRWYEYTGTSPDEMLGWGWQSVHHPDVLPEMIERWTTALRTGQPFEMTFPLRRGSDGSFRSFMTRAEPLREDGRIVGWFGTNTDVTEQEQTLERLKLVVNELNHRVKNMLATVQAIGHTSFHASDRQAYEVFEDRLLSLSQVHDLLTRREFTGTSLRELLEMEVASFDGRRFDLSGEDVVLEPRIVTALAMMLHELGTNAVKYGALSNETGRVAIEWQTFEIPRQEWLKLSWREEGGPPVTPPERRGFGCTLIRRAVTGEQGATIEHAFEPDGVRCVARLPIRELVTR